MLIRITFVLKFLMILMDCNSQQLQGLSFTQKYVYYSYNNIVECQNLITNKIEYKLQLKNESTLNNLLIRKTLKLFANYQKIDSLEVKVGISKYRVVNVTCYIEKVYIGIAYYILSHEQAKLEYAIIELNSKLDILNYYVFANLPAYLSYPPFFELEFESANRILLPVFSKGKLTISSFILNRNNEIRKLKTKKTIPKGINVKVTTPNMIVLDPILFSVSHSKYSYYFIYPYSQIFDSTVFLDYFNDMFYIDSSQNSKRIEKMSKNQIDPFSLHFENSFSNFTIISSLIESESMILLISDNKTNKVHLIVYSFANKSIVKTNQFPYSSDAYYYLTTKNIYITCFEDNRWRIKKIPF